MECGHGFLRAFGLLFPKYRSGRNKLTVPVGLPAARGLRELDSSHSNVHTCSAGLQLLIT